MGIFEIDFPEMVDFLELGATVLIGITIAPWLNHALAPGSQVLLSCLGLIVILGCGAVVKSQLRLLITEVVFLLRCTREELRAKTRKKLDAGRADQTSQQKIDVEPKDVDSVNSVGLKRNDSSVDSASETKLCRSDILELSTAPTTATYHHLDQTANRVTYEGPPVRNSKARVSKTRALSGLTKSMDDRQVGKDRPERSDDQDYDEDYSEDEGDSYATKLAAQLAAELEALEPREGAQDSEHWVPREVSYYFCALAFSIPPHPL